MVAVATVISFCVVFNLVVFAFFLDPRVELRGSSKEFFYINTYIFLLVRGHDETIAGMHSVLDNDPTTWSLSNICTWAKDNDEPELSAKCMSMETR